MGDIAGLRYAFERYFLISCRLPSVTCLTC